TPPPRPQSLDLDAEAFERVADPSEFDNREGYDANFLGIEVPLPRPTGAMADDVLEYENTAGKSVKELRYTHFTLVMSRSRRLCMFTAVNIAGDELEELVRAGDPWALDPRIPSEAQFDNA